MDAETYMKDGVECFKVNDCPSSKNIYTNIKQLLAVADWEMTHFDGRVSTRTAAALVKHLKEAHHA